MSFCPCKSGKSYQSCCQVYIQGEKIAPTALALMRSRYTAYALGNSQYLTDTWYKRFRPESIQLDPGLHWINLEIIDKSAEKSNIKTAMVHFQAFSIYDGQVDILEEKSNFIKDNGKWFYSDGELIPAQLSQPGRNSPCPCGSKKKFKRCCLTL